MGPKDGESALRGGDEEVETIRVSLQSRHMLWLQDCIYQVDCLVTALSNRVKPSSSIKRIVLG